LGLSDFIGQNTTTKSWSIPLNNGETYTITVSPTDTNSIDAKNIGLSQSVTHIVDYINPTPTPTPTQTILPLLNNLFKEYGRIQVDGNPTDVIGYNNKIYVTNDSKNMCVIDTLTHTIIKEISTGNGTVSIDIDPLTNHGYVLNHYNNKVYIIDTTIDEIVHTVDVASGANQIIVDYESHTTYVCNTPQKTLTAIKKYELTWYIDTVLSLNQNPIQLKKDKDNKVYVVYQPYDIETGINGLVSNVSVNNSKLSRIIADNNTYSLIEIDTTENTTVGFDKDNIFAQKLNLSNVSGPAKLQIIDKTNSAVLAEYTNILNAANFSEIESDDNDNVFLVNNIGDNIIVLDGQATGVDPNIKARVSVGQNPVAIGFAVGVLPSPTPSITPTITPTVTSTPTPTITPTNTLTPTNTPTSTVTPTNTVTPSITATRTPTATPTQTRAGCLITNGNFSQPVGTTNGWLSSDIDLWQFGTTDNHYAVDLNGCTSGYLQQTINTVSGTVYNLRFNYAANNYSHKTNLDNPIKTFTVKIINALNNTVYSTQNYSFDVTQYLGYFGDYNAMGWLFASQSFTAVSSSTIIRFESTCPSCGCYGAAIDNICIASSGCNCDYVIPATPTPTPTKTPTTTPTTTPTKTPTPTITPTPTSTPTVTPTRTPTTTPTNTRTPTVTPTPSDPTISRAYIANYGSNSITILHTVNQTVLNTLNNITKPTQLTTNQNESVVYVATEDSTDIVLIDASNYDRSSRTLNLGSDTNIKYLELNDTDTELYVCSSPSSSQPSDIVRLFSNTSTPSIIYYTYAGTDIRKVLFHNNQLYVFDISNLYVFSADLTSLLYSNALSHSYKTSFLNIENNRLYIALSNNTISVYDISSGAPSLITNIILSSSHNGISDITVNRYSGDIYVVCSNSKTVVVIDADTNAVLTSFSTNNQFVPYVIGITDNGSFGYILYSDSTIVDVYAIETNTYLKTLTVGLQPKSIAILNSILVTPTPTPSPTKTSTVTPTKTPTRTPTATPTITPTRTQTPTASPIPPYITIQPTDTTTTQKPIGDGAAIFEVVGGPFYAIYQWEKSVNGTSWTAIPNSNGSYLTLDDLTTLDNNVFYRVKLTNAFGSVTSNTALLTVLGPSLSIVSQPTDQTIGTNGSVTFTVSLDTIFPTPTPTLTLTPTITPTVSQTPSITPTRTPTNTQTPTNTSTPSPTSSITPTRTATPTITPTISITPTITPTNTITSTPTKTPTATKLIIPTVTPTKTRTPTPSPQLPISGIASSSGPLLTSSGGTYGWWTTQIDLQMKLNPLSSYYKDCSFITHLDGNYSGSNTINVINARYYDPILQRFKSLPTQTYWSGTSNIMAYSTTNKLKECLNTYPYRIIYKYNFEAWGGQTYDVDAYVEVAASWIPNTLTFGPYKIRLGAPMIG
jgi:DNA-binding beta-propeller fold protein YncE